MFIIKYRKWFFGLTVALVVASLASIFSYGLHMGTEFTGGTFIEASYADGRPAPETLEQSLRGAGFTGFSIREAGDSAYIIRAEPITQVEREGLQATLDAGGKTAVIEQLTEVGPTIGAELRSKAAVALLLVFVCIMLFIAFAFRKVSKPISSWVYGLIALVTLIHDTIVPVGVYALLGHLTGAQVDTLFVTAILTVVGFSVHDTIVVFDRTRENLRLNAERGRKEPFAETAGRSLSQTFTRSINTSLTVVITLVVLYVIGPVSTEIFSLTLLVGIVVGTYSSVFLATPLLVEVAERRKLK